MLGFWDGYESDASAEEAVVLADAVVDQQAASEVYADRSARVQFLLAEQRARKMLVQLSNALVEVEQEAHRPAVEALAAASAAAAAAVRRRRWRWRGRLCAVRLRRGVQVRGDGAGVLMPLWQGASFEL